MNKNNKFTMHKQNHLFLFPTWEEVWLNEQHLGITWTRPYRFDITDNLKSVDNMLVVEIANT
jgi:hypothetical protein